MLQILAIAAIATAFFILCFLCLKFYIRDKKGEIQIIFDGFEKEENGIVKTSLVLDISYFLMRNTRNNKEQSAIFISNMVRDRYTLKEFRVGKNIEETLKEIKGIIRDIRPLIPYETDSELTKVNYRISQITIPSWPKGIFAQS